MIAIGMSMGGTFPQSNLLQGLVATTMEDQLCKGPPHRTKLTSAELWYPLILPLECFACGGGWVVLLHGLKLPTSSRASWEVQANVSH